MTPWELFGAMLVTVFVFALLFLSLYALIGAVQAWDEWRVEKRERLLEAEHRKAEL